MAARRRTIEELREAGGGIQRPTGPAGEFLPDAKIIERQIDETIRDSSLLRRVEATSERHFKDLDEFSSSEVEFVENLTGKDIQQLSHQDISTAIRQELGQNETRLASQRARLASQADREAQAEADAIQRGIDKAGLEDIPAVPAVREAAQAVPEQQALQPPAQPPTPPRGPVPTSTGGTFEAVPIPEAIRATTPQAAAENILGLRPITPGLTRTQAIMNIVRRTIKKIPGTKPVLDDPVAQAALAERSRAANVIDVQANILSTSGEQRVAAAFVRNKRGQIESLKGVVPELAPPRQGGAQLAVAPTIQDIAARLPRYEPFLTPEQRLAMAGLREDTAPFRKVLDEVGAAEDLGFRTDVMEGGFYLPRGRALEEGSEAPFKVRAGGRTGEGRRGFEQPASFDSQAQGIEAGFEYASLGQVLESYARNVGQKATDAHIANFLKSVTDEAGELLGRPLGAADTRTTGIIQLPNVQDWAFPDELANAANKILKREGAPLGKGSQLLETNEAFENMYRGLRATADNSAPGIQGLLGLASNPRAWKEAMKVNIAAWGNGGDAVLGRFILEFNNAATQSGRLSAQQWAAQGIRVSGAQTEFELGRGIARIRNLPVIRQANRAFGFFGDSLRLEWADDVLKEELRRRSMNDIAASGDLRLIAGQVNRSTGWAAGRTGGFLGDLFLFAPRFLQSRLETTVNGVLGLRPGANLAQRQARRSLLRLIGYGTMLTFSINEMLGNETDVRPIVNGRKNPNFMRIRAAGRDWSLFGTWDSLMGAFISVGQGRPQDVLKSMGAGKVSIAWDLISGTEFSGKEVPNTTGEIIEDPLRFGEWALGSVSPFAADEVPTTIKQIAGGVREGDPGQIGAGLATLTGEVFGAKSTPQSFRDVANIQGEEIGLPAGESPDPSLRDIVGTRSFSTIADGIVKRFFSPSLSFETADPFLKDIIETYPSVVAVANRRPSSLYWRQRNEIDANRLVDLQALLKNKNKVIAGQRIDDRFITDKYFQIVSEAVNLKKGQNLGADKEFADPDLPSLTPTERALAMWHDLTEAEAMEEVFVAKRLQQRRDKFQKDLLRQPDGRELWDYVLRNINRHPIPVGIMNILRIQAKSTWNRINASNQARSRWLAQNLPGLQIPETVAPQSSSNAPAGQGPVLTPELLRGLPSR